MAKAIVARENGDDYQRLVLWQYINDFLLQDSNIDVIWHEYCEVKGFDDIVIKYKKPIIVSGDRSVEKQYIQVKFHQYQSDFLTIDNLMKPKFINSSKQSFLMKLRDAYYSLGDEYTKCRFTLYTPFDIDQNDVLYDIVDNQNRIINHDKLFDGTVRSKRAKEKNRILEHLNVNEEEIKSILERVNFYRGQPVPELIHGLNIYLASNGLSSMSQESVCNTYISLAKSWLSGSKLELTREFILKECKAEKLFVESEECNDKFAIKTFVNNTSYLNAQEIETLDLSDLFEEGKFLKEDLEWEFICQNVKEFCAVKENSEKIYSVHLECALTVAFLSGRVLNPKSGLCVYPMQKTVNGIVAWRDEPDTGENSFNHICEYEECIVNDAGTESVILLSITHDIEPDVLEYLRLHRIDVYKIHRFKSKNLGPDTIKNGIQCWNVATYISKQLGTRSHQEKKATTHIFSSAPAALLFSLGKLSLNMGRLTFYEHDMKYVKEDIYYKSAVFPIRGE